MKLVSIFGDPVIAVLSIIIASLYFFLTYRRREICFTLAVIFADLCNMLLKILIHRPWPTLENAKIVLQFTQSGFPSAHVVYYVVFFGFLLAVMLVHKNISLFLRIFVGTLSAFLILAVSISRIYLDAHWATDVMGGGPLCIYKANYICNILAISRIFWLQRGLFLANLSVLSGHFRFEIA